MNTEKKEPNASWAKIRFLRIYFTHRGEKTSSHKIFANGRQAIPIKVDVGFGNSSGGTVLPPNAEILKAVRLAFKGSPTKTIDHRSDAIDGLSSTQTATTFSPGKYEYSESAILAHEALMDDVCRLIITEHESIQKGKDFSLSKYHETSTDGVITFRSLSSPSTHWDRSEFESTYNHVKRYGSTICPPFDPPKLDETCHDSSDQLPNLLTDVIDHINQKKRNEGAKANARYVDHEGISMIRSASAPNRLWDMAFFEAMVSHAEKHGLPWYVDATVTDDDIALTRTVGATSEKLGGVVDIKTLKSLAKTFGWHLDDLLKQAINEASSLDEYADADFVPGYLGGNAEPNIGIDIRGIEHSTDTLPNIMEDVKRMIGVNQLAEQYGLRGPWQGIHEYAYAKTGFVRSLMHPKFEWDRELFDAILAYAEAHGLPVYYPQLPYASPQKTILIEDKAAVVSSQLAAEVVPYASTVEGPDTQGIYTVIIFVCTGQVTSDGIPMKLIAACVNDSNTVVAHSGWNSPNDTGWGEAGSGDQKGIEFSSYIDLTGKKLARIEQSNAAWGNKKSDGKLIYTKTKGDANWASYETWMTLSYGGHSMNWIHRGPSYQPLLWADGGKADGWEWSYFTVAQAQSYTYIDGYLSDGPYYMKGTSPIKKIHGAILDKMKGNIGSILPITFGGGSLRLERLFIGSIGGKEHWQHYKKNESRVYDSTTAFIAAIDKFGNTHEFYLNISEMASILPR